MLRYSKGLDNRKNYLPQNQVRVWLRDCLHGDTPFTEQPGGCGEQGNHMQVTLEFSRNMILLVN